MRRYSREDFERVFERQLGEPLPNVTPQLPREVSTVQRHRLGARLAEDDRVFRYAHVLATTTELCPSARGAINTGTVRERAGNTVVNARAIGSKTVLITALNDVVADEFAGGYLLYGDADSGRGRSDPILSNTAALTGANYTVTLKYLTTGRLTALDGITVVPSIYANIEYCALGTAGYETVVGVPLIDIPADNYAWIQTWGFCQLVTGNPPMGSTGWNREVVFGSNGAVFVRHDPYTEGYQFAGVIATRTWYDANGGAAGQNVSGHILMLMP